MDLESARVVAILTRAPAAGGKSRLFRALGVQTDPQLLTALLLDTLDGVTLPGVRCVVAVEPAWRCDEVRQILPPSVMVVGQSGGSLGERMRNVMADVLYAHRADAVVLIGSDLPEIDPAVIAEAFSSLDEDRDALVLGPAIDGGYYLIAARRVPDVFSDIRWGSATVLDATLMAATRHGIRVRLLRPLGDVDTPADLARVAAQSDVARAVRTRAWAVARDAHKP